MDGNREVKIRAICAWCKKVVEEGDQLVPVTDVICDECKQKELEIFERDKVTMLKEK